MSPAAQLLTQSVWITVLIALTIYVIKQILKRD
jgi:hypothetical protein